MSSRPGTGIVAALSAEALYGVSYVLTRGALAGAAPLAVLAWRFDIALVLFAGLALLGVVHLDLRRNHLRPALLLAGLDPVLYYLGETLGVQHTSASISGLVLSAIPVASIVAAALLLGSRPSRRQVVGVAITLIGVVLTVLAGGLPRGGQAFGFAMLLLAVVAFALFTVCAEQSDEVSAAGKAFVMTAVGAVVFTVAALCTEGGHQLARTIQAPGVAPRVVLLAVGCTVGAYLLQNVGIAQLGSAGYATFVGISTVVALAAGALLLGEHLLWLQLAGGALVLAGVYVANRR